VCFRETRLSPHLKTRSRELLLLLLPPPPLSSNANALGASQAIFEQTTLPIDIAVVLTSTRPIRTLFRDTQAPGQVPLI
jgi:hypothetical protein